MNPSEYMQTKEMLETAEEMVNTQKELTVNSIVSKGYNPNKIKTLCTILQNTVDKKLAPSDQTEEESESSEGATENMSESSEEKADSPAVEKTDEEIAKEEEELKAKKKQLLLSLVKAKLEAELVDVRNGILLDPSSADEIEDKDEEINKILESFSDMVDYLDTEREFEIVKSYRDREADKMVEYMNSEEYYKKRLEENEEDRKELQQLESVTGKNRNYKRIRELQQKVAVTDGRFDFSFMKLNPKITIKNTVETFFDGRKSGYVMQRYYDKCAQLNLNADVFRYFMNIEEKNLEEKYHPFNNLFLFHCIRYMAYLDTTYDDLQFRTIVGTLTKLVYDKFPNEETKETTLNMIRTYLDQYIDGGYTEYFLEKNESHPKHPERIKKDEMREKSAREYYYSIIRKSLPDVDFPITKEVEGMTIPELAEYAKKVSDEALEKQKDELAEQFTEKTDEDDSEECDSNEDEGSSVEE